MKKIVCELCEGTEFTKENGMFVCQGCGTKYSAEEARSMMREVEGDAPVSTGAPVVGAPMGNPNQQQIDNLLILATNAKEASNNQEAENYCNQVIALDATAYKAWFLKGKAIGWSTTLGNNRMEEAAHSFCQAIDFAPEEEKEELKNQAVEELKNLGLACIALRKQNFSNSPSKSNLDGFTNDRAILLKALMVLLSHGHAIGMPEGYLETIAAMMNEAGVAAINTVRAAWNKVDHASHSDWKTYLDWCSNIEQLFREAIDASDEDDEADIVRYKNLAIVLEEPIESCSWKREWYTYSSGYRWVRDYSLTDAAKSKRRQEAKEARDKAAELERKAAEKKAAEARKAAEEKKARIDAYWAAHPDEKAALDTEKSELTEKKIALDSEIAELDKIIVAGKAEEKTKGSYEIESDKLKKQIGELEARYSSLGIFAGKEKKQLREEIEQLQTRVDSLSSKVKKEKKSKAEEIQTKLAPTHSKRNGLISERTEIINRISAIDAELTKDPEE